VHADVKNGKGVNDRASDESAEDAEPVQTTLF
jgi:hypothetical protein